MQELVNSPPCRHCRGNPTVAESRRSVARLRAYLVLFRERYGGALDDRQARLLERALVEADTLADLTGLPEGTEPHSDEGETAELV